MYVYQADTWCDSCGADIIRTLESEGYVPTIPDDSDHWPQSAAEEETDGPDHCASAGECLEAIDLADYGFAPDASLYGAESRKIGALLSPDLTEAGYAYLAEMLAESDPTPYQRALHALWREAFPQVESVELDALKERAHELGEDHGRGAASWFFDGNTTDETYARVLAGIEEGEPMILDTFPSAPLSGEWADDPTPATLLRDLGLEPGDDRVDELCDAYEDGFYSAVSAEIERVARFHVELKEVQS